MWLSLLAAICLAVVIVFAKSYGPIPAQTSTRPTKPSGRPRNLRLQPEAAKLAKALGKRFAAEKKLRSVLVGSLTIDGVTRAVSVIRQQQDDGEEVNIQLNGSQTALAWSLDTAAIADGSRAAGAERTLIERLVFDSPDQFVLAHLRGASYFTVARHVRPTEATDGYEGPLWDVVRVDVRRGMK
jgi:ABC-type phosphate transport system substrate-binding protein